MCTCHRGDPLQLFICFREWAAPSIGLWLHGFATFPRLSLNRVWYFDLVDPSFWAGKIRLLDYMNQILKSSSWVLLHWMLIAYSIAIFGFAASSASWSAGSGACPYFSFTYIIIIMLIHSHLEIKPNHAN